MNDLYNPNEKSIYLQYLDANHLSGWAMVQNLPTHEFKWENGEDFTPEKIDELVKKDKKEYLLEVDVKYPKELHENHNELPFLKERIKIGMVEKLVPNLKRKKRYVVHIKALEQALKHGSQLKKVHRVIKFQQSRWMKAYIMLNKRLRKEAKNEFEEEFFKLMNNSVFGKTMANIRKYVMKSNLKDGHPFSKHLFALEKKRDGKKRDYDEQASAPWTGNIRPK